MNIRILRLLPAFLLIHCRSPVVPTGPSGNGPITPIQDHQISYPTLNPILGVWQLTEVLIDGVREGDPDFFVEFNDSTTQTIVMGSITRCDYNIGDTRTYELRENLLITYGERGESDTTTVNFSEGEMRFTHPDNDVVLIFEKTSYLSLAEFIDETCGEDISENEDVFEPDDTRSQASHINSSGAEQRHTLTQNDEDWHYFYGASGTEYTIETAGALDTRLFVYYESSMLSSDDDGGERLNAKIQFTANQNGTYYIRITGFSSNQVGPYTVSIESIGP